MASQQFWAEWDRFIEFAPSKDTPIHTQPEVLEWLKKFEKWPLAHYAAIRRLSKQWDHYFRFKPAPWTPEYDEVQWPEPTALEAEWQPTESDLGLPDYELVEPGGPEDSGLPFADRKDQSTDPDWINNAGKAAGRILFSTKPLPADLKGSFQLMDEFDISMHPVFARAVWPRAIYNYPIGQKEDGTPVYPPEGLMKKFTTGTKLLFSLRVIINGEIVLPKYGYRDAFCYTEMNDQKFYDAEQTLGFTFVGMFNEISTQWELKSRQMYGHLLRAGPGVHTVGVLLQYAIIDGNPFSRERRYGPANIDSLISHPLAQGAFQITVPEGWKMPDTFKESVVEPEVLAYLKKNYNSNIIWCKQEQDWDIVVSEKEIQEYDRVGDVTYVTCTPARYGKVYGCLVYESPETNPECRQEGVFKVSVLVIGGTEPKTWEVIHGHKPDWEGYPFEVDFLPEALIAKIPKRCAPEKRNI